MSEAKDYGSKDCASEVLLKIGDVVELAGGGPDMTVTEVYGAGSVTCAWITSDDERPESYTYPVAALTLLGRRCEEPGCRKSVRVDDGTRFCDAHEPAGSEAEG